jgi:circadian clock protein KaiC
LTDSARLAQEAKDKAAELVREQEMERRGRELERKRREINAQIEVLQAALAAETRHASTAKEWRARINSQPIELPWV